MPASEAAPEVLTEEGLRDLADRLWHELPHGAVVWLSGDLGTGKTTFAQAVTAAAGAERARSPTFALVHEYDSPSGPIAHVDCYRLREPREAIDVDFPGLLRRVRLLLVEWPERARGFAPAPDAHLTFAHAERPDQREVERVT